MEQCFEEIKNISSFFWSLFLVKIFEIFSTDFLKPFPKYKLPLLTTVFTKFVFDLDCSNSVLLLFNSVNNELFSSWFLSNSSSLKVIGLSSLPSIKCEAFSEKASSSFTNSTIKLSFDWYCDFDKSLLIF